LRKFAFIGHDACPIAPVLLGDAKISGLMSNELFAEGIYVIGFSYPVVPKVKLYLELKILKLF